MPWIIGGSPTLSWSEARDKVRGDLWRASATALPDDVVDRALHASILEIEAARSWQWLQSISAALELDADDDNLDLPASCGLIHSLSVFFSGNLSPDILELAPISRLREWSRSSQGVPSRYAISNGTAYFDCIAPAGTKFELIFDAKCPDFLADAIESPPLTLSLHQQAVLSAAKSYAALEFLHDDDKAARNRSAFEAHLRRMEDRDDQLRGDDAGGMIQPNTTGYFAPHGA